MAREVREDTCVDADGGSLSSDSRESEQVFSIVECYCYIFEVPV